MRISIEKPINHYYPYYTYKYESQIKRNDGNGKDDLAASAAFDDFASFDGGIVHVIYAHGNGTGLSAIGNEIYAIDEPSTGPGAPGNGQRDEQ